MFICTSDFLVAKASFAHSNPIGSHITATESVQIITLFTFVKIGSLMAFQQLSQLMVMWSQPLVECWALKFRKPESLRITGVVSPTELCHHHTSVFIRKKIKMQKVFITFFLDTTLLSTAFMNELQLQLRSKHCQFSPQFLGARLSLCLCFISGQGVALKVYLHFPFRHTYRQQHVTLPWFPISNVTVE